MKRLVRKGRGQIERSFIMATYASFVRDTAVDGRTISINSTTKELEVSPNVMPFSGRTYYVDKWNGSATSDGLSWNTALSTIAAAITKVNDRIDWSNYPKAISTIYIAPGVYAEALTTPPFDCRMIGLGIPGTDQCTEIHPASGTPLAGTALGLYLKNIRFEAVGAVPILDFGIVGSTVIEDCELMNGDYTNTHGISTETASHMTVRRCIFGSGSTKMTHGIYAAGGADKYFHHCTVEDCQIYAGIGIYIQNTCTGTHSVIQRNFIEATTLAIDDDSDDVNIINNRWTSAAVLASSYDINLAKAAGNIATGSDNTLEVPICAV